MVSGQVRYTQRVDTIWQLPVAIEATTNKSRGYLIHTDMFVYCCCLQCCVFTGEYDAWVKKKAELQAAKMRMLELLWSCSIYRICFYI